MVGQETVHSVKRLCGQAFGGKNVLDTEYEY